MRSKSVTETADMKARLAWMETLINREDLLRPGQSADYANGTYFSEVAFHQPSSNGTISHPTASVDGGETVTSSPQSRRHLDHASPMEPPSKRLRLSESPVQVRAGMAKPQPTPQPTPQPMPQPMPQPPTSRDYINAYFQDVNRAYPFVDRKRVLAVLETRGDNVCETSDADSTLLHLVIAIGYTTLQRAGKVPTPDAGPAFKVNYKEILAECLMRENIDTVQILLLLSIYSLFDPDGLLTWPIVDVLARQAIRLGLTRRDTADQGYTPQEAERNRRLFWSIYTLDRMVAASLGTPVAMNDVNMNIPLPGITVEEFASGDRFEYISMLQVARHLIELRILEDKVLSKVHHRSHKATRGLTQADRRAIVMGLRTEIENWYSNGCLLKSTEPDEVMIHIRISWLAARYYNLLLLLYYPSHFNPVASSLLSRGELVALAQKHVQSNAVRFQQRQLPLNHVTLCRLFPVCMIFLHYALPQSASNEDFGARDEIVICADIMAAYPSHWTLAHRAAAVVRQMASPLTTPVTAGGSTPYGSARAPRSVCESDRAWRHAIRVNFLELTQQVMGRGSAYHRLEYWEDGPGGQAAGERQQQATAPGSLFHIAPQRASGSGAAPGADGTGGIGRGITSRATLPFEEETSADAGDVFAGVQSFMDFL